MQELSAPKLTKWPFIAGDAILVAAAAYIYTQPKVQLGSVELSLMVLLLVCGALLSIIPFILEYRALVRVAEAGALTDVVAQVNQLEAVAAQISSATGRWQNVQDEADKTAAAAKGIAERMGAEVKGFTEFMQRMNDSEKTTLRLEAEKLRRGEAEWVQVLMRVLDHVYALHVGAVKSGQPNLIDQLTNFQNACRDAVRRVGMVPFAAGSEEVFDPKRHQVLDGNGAPEGATVIETVATGYTFQGRLVRPALVRLNSSVAAAAGPGNKATERD